MSHFCDKSPRFIQSHPKDRSPCPTAGFEPALQEPSDPYAVPLTAAQRPKCIMKITNLILRNCEAIS
jgi:hypothetical protein